ncbi:MAG TPA: CARDB domain-containing protein, partial [Thermoplasmata archaeon]|nr:CARDB domain-containing protein [Thermoplasmata archaeon]
MSSRSERNAKALTCLIVWSVALGGLFAAIVALSPAARAGTCDQVGGVITGDWTITTAQVCTGIVYSVDGSININAGGSLTLVNGGLSFSKDTSHEGYALSVNAGGELVLDNSIVTTQTDAISPFLKLAFTVSGANSHFAMKNGAVLKFPGWFNATGTTIDMTGSTITGFSSTELFGLGVYNDDNDDSPLISWASTTASLYGSRIERIYENATASSGNATGPIEGNVALTASSNLYAYDSYIGVDFSNVLGLHNALQVDGTSNAYLYAVTIDRSQDPVLKSTWQPAYEPLAAGGNVFLLRWLRASVVDSTGFPVSGATIWSTLSPSATTAQYPDNGLSSTPSARTLAYLGRAASGANAWNHTDSSGLAVIPLYTDVITTASLPNAESFGNYQLTVAFAATTGPGAVDFDPYPAISADNNTKSVNVGLAVQVRTGPDLTVAPASPTMTVLQNQPFTVYALISNQGQTTASGVSVAAYLDGNRAVTYGRVDSLTVATSLNQTMTIQGVATVGAHTLELIVDPDNTINEGGSAQENNNFANITLNVQPPPAGFTAILTPTSGQSVVSGNAVSVTGYVRDSGSNGIGGVVLTIELRSGATVLATNSTMSDNNGLFVGTIVVPSNTQDGQYSIVVTPSTTLIQPDTTTIAVQKSSSFLFQKVPVLGIEWWLFLVILAAAAAVAIGVSLYWKVYGLGKMVECGECGAFIPEDATTCPKCGVEFE